MKGINGHAVPLLGCVCNSPVDIGGHAVNHHFFVSSEGAGKQEIILGQPWMLWYAADILYSQSEDIQLHLWENGDGLRLMHLPEMILPRGLILFIKTSSVGLAVSPFSRWTVDQSSRAWSRFYLNSMALLQLLPLLTPLTTTLWLNVCIPLLLNLFFMHVVLTLHYGHCFYLLACWLCNAQHLI